jgi:hypothetical protein
VRIRRSRHPWRRLGRKLLELQVAVLPRIGSNRECLRPHLGAHRQWKCSRGLRRALGPLRLQLAMVDSFDRWVESIHAERLGRTVGDAICRSIDYYSGVFDSNGSWDYLPSYGGYVWYPAACRRLAPVLVGSWSAYARTSAGLGRCRALDVPTHHYGRWGRRESLVLGTGITPWAPAWVSWAARPATWTGGPLGYKRVSGSPASRPASRRALPRSRGRRGVGRAVCGVFVPYVHAMNALRR